VAVEGGFSQQSDLLTRLPVFVIYADGSLVAPGHLDGINPMIRPLVRLQVQQADRERVDELIEEMGLHRLDRIIDEPRPGTVVDASTTVATYFDAAKREHEFGAYGLSPQTGAPLPPEIGFLPETNALAELASMFSRSGADTGAEPYRPGRIQLFLTQPTSPGDVLPWPLDIVPNTFAPGPESDIRCLVVTGAAADDAAAALADKDRNVIFEYEEEQLWLLARILLPGESGCGPLIRL
jgi:hypothetical protein